MTDISIEPIVDTEPDEKKVAKLEQLSQARESAKVKRQREKQTMIDMNTKLDTLLLAKGEEEQPIKRIKVTKEAETEPDEEPETKTSADSLVVTALRTGAVLGLAGVSWYVQNVWKKETPVTARKPHAQATTQATPKINMLPVPRKIGKSGFVV
jgi:hypothetical protein